MELIKPWRIKILNVLKERIPKDFASLENYEKAVENSSWTKGVNCKCLLPKENNFKDCMIELEWISEECEVESGTLEIFDVYKSETWSKYDLKNVSAVISCCTSQNPRLSIFSSDCLAPLKLQFKSELLLLYLNLLFKYQR